jgi:hypothetical protein
VIVKNCTNINTSHLNSLNTKRDQVQDWSWICFCTKYNLDFDLLQCCIQHAEFIIPLICRWPGAVYVFSLSSKVLFLYLGKFSTWVSSVIIWFWGLKRSVLNISNLLLFDWQIMIHQYIHIKHLFSLIVG